MKFKPNEFFSLIFCLLPVVLIVGRAPSDIFLTLVSSFFLVSYLSVKIPYFYKNNFIIFMFIFYFYLLISSAFSQFPFISISHEGTLFYFRYIFFIIAVNYLIYVNPRLLDYFLYVSLICLCVLFFDGTLQFISGSNILGFEKPNNRITSLMGDEEILGRYVSYISTICLIIVSNSNNIKIKKLIFLFLPPFSLYLILISGDRAPFLSYCIFLSLLFLINFEQKKFLVFGSLSFLAISILIINNSDIVKARYDQTIRQITGTSFAIAPFSKHYEDIFRGAISIGQENKLFGIGSSLYEKYCQDKSKIYSDLVCSSHPHNYYIQIYTENGFVGLLFLFSLYFSLIFKLLEFIYLNKIKKMKNQNKTNVIATFALLAYLMPLIPNMSFYNNWNNVFIYIMLSYYLYFNFIKKET